LRQTTYVEDPWNAALQLKVLSIFKVDIGDDLLVKIKGIRAF